MNGLNDKVSTNSNTHIYDGAEFKVQNLENVPIIWVRLGNDQLNLFFSRVAFLDFVEKLKDFAVHVDGSGWKSNPMAGTLDREGS